MRIAFEALYLFLICWLLAKVEIHIEGPHGWAEKLPTWKTHPGSWIARILGKPVTGYHVFFNASLLSLFHLPLMFVPFSWEIEAKILSLFFLTTVLWDFQWFAWNPAWGIRRFFNETIWWFPKKLMGFPREYFFGLSASFLAIALLWPQGVNWWMALSFTAVGFSTASALIAEANLKR